MATLVNNQLGGFTAENELAPYQEYTVVSKYTWNEGLIQLPVAEAPQGTPGAPDSLGGRNLAEIVREHAPCGQKAVSFTATRMGAPPVVPHPLSYRNDANEVFAYADVAVVAPSLKLLGDRTWTMQGTYVYYLLKPIWMADGLSSGATPYDTTMASLNVYPSSSFNINLQ